MSIAGNLGPASLANALINQWALTNLENIRQGALPGLRDLNTTFSALLSQPFSRDPGGGVGDIQNRNRLLAGQYNPQRGMLASQGGDLSNMFANVLTQGAGNLLNINNAILSSRSMPSGFTSFLQGLAG